MAMPVKFQYRISTWRFDVPRSTHSTPEFEGDTIEECDEKALKHFNALAEKDRHGYDGMDIVRIDAPAIAELATKLADNGKQKGDGDYEL